MSVRKIFSAMSSRPEHHDITTLNAVMQLDARGVRGDGRAHLKVNPRCPECKAFTYRVRRRYIDLLTSTFSPVQRYRCTAMACPWEGNLPKRI